MGVLGHLCAGQFLDVATSLGWLENEIHLYSDSDDVSEDSASRS